MAVNNTWNATAPAAVNTASSPPWSAGTAPANTEVVLFPDGNMHSATGASAAAVQLAECRVNRGYSGDIGSAGTHWTISATLWQLFGSGNIYLTQGSGTSPVMVIDMKTPSATVTLAGATWTNVAIVRGTLEVDGTITNLHVGTRGGNNGDVTVNINSGGGIATNIYQSSGRVYSESGNAHTIWNVGGGTGELASAGTGVTTLSTSGDGQMVYKPSSTITLLTVGGRSTCDLSQLTGALTITTSFKMPQATLIGSEDSGLITFTNALRKLGSANL